MHELTPFALPPSSPRLLHALQVTSDIGLSPAGSNWLWALFGIFTISLLILLGLAHSRPQHHRAFHYIGVVILAITAVHYAIEASNLGYASVPVEWVRSGSRGQLQVLAGAPSPPTRSIFYSQVRLDVFETGWSGAASESRH